MSRRSRRVTVNLDAKGLKGLSVDDLKAVLRGADDLIAQGGRTLLMRILRGSANKDVLERGLDQSPVYGLCLLQIHPKRPAESIRDANRRSGGAAG